MRLLIFTDSFYPELGGIQDSVLATARAMGERGHQVLICAPAASTANFELRKLPVGEVQLGPNVSVRRLFALPVPSSTQQSRLALPMFRRWRSLANFRPDLVHTHTFLGAGLEAVHVARRIGVPLVGTNHWAIGAFAAYAPIGHRCLARLAVSAVTRYYNRCDFVTGPSRSVIDEMLATGLRTPCAVISNPLDTSTFQPRSGSRKSELKHAWGFSEATIMYAGRLAIEKNIDVLIRALALIKPQVPAAMLVLAGHGTARARLERLAIDLDVADSVRFTGTLDKQRLADVFAAADVFAIASTSETQSMVLLQAMGCGLPAVGAHWRALPEYIASDCGFTAQPGDPKDFAAKFHLLLKEPAFRRRLGRNAARRALTYATADVADQWEEAYASILPAVHGAKSRRSPSESLQCHTGFQP